MLVCPAPLPDELDRGYLGRVMRLNGVTLEHRMHALLYRYFGLDQTLARYHRAPVEALSMMAEMTTEQFIQSHSTMPLRRAVTEYCSDLAHGSTERRTLLYNSAMRLIGDYAYFCPECATADVAFHGMAYWRRSLQVPGRLWCERHQAALQRAPSRALFDSPTNWIKGAARVPDRLIAAGASNEAVIRYFGIAEELMRTTAPISRRSLRLAFLNRARKLKEEENFLGKTSGSISLSRILQMKFPDCWLCAIDRDISDKNAERILTKVDRMQGRYFPNTVWPYLLLASSLYGEESLALRDWAKAAALEVRRGMTSQIFTRRNTRATHDDKELVP